MSVVPARRPGQRRVGAPLRRALARRLGAGARQVAILIAALSLCPVASVLIGSDPSEPIARAQALLRAEAWLGLDVEAGLNAWTTAHAWLGVPAAVVYVVAHIAVPGWALVWTWFVRPDRFAYVRDALLWTQGMLITGYLSMPTAPPRLLPGAGFGDAVSEVWGTGFSDSTAVLQSPFAAMPSGHVAFAVLAGVTFARFGDMAWLRAFGWVWPPVMALLTIITGNHFLVDAAAGAAVAAAGTGLAALTERRRRRPRRPHPPAPLDRGPAPGATGSAG